MSLFAAKTFLIRGILFFMKYSFGTAFAVNLDYFYNSAQCPLTSLLATEMYMRKERRQMRATPNTTESSNTKSISTLPSSRPVSFCSLQYFSKIPFEDDQRERERERDLRSWWSSMLSIHQSSDRLGELIQATSRTWVRQQVNQFQDSSKYFFPSLHQCAVCIRNRKLAWSF